MNWLDLLLIAILILAILWGGKFGAIKQFGASVGLLIGLCMALFVASKLATMLPTDAQRFFFLLPLCALIAFLFFDIGKYGGEWLHKKLTRHGDQNMVDKIGGMLIAGFTCIVVIWLGSVLIWNVPFSPLAKQIQTSGLITRLSSELPAPPTFVTQVAQLIRPHAEPRLFLGGEPVAELPVQTTPLPDFPSIAKQTEPSVIKVLGEGCGGITTGSGFVVADKLVATGAHVVAGLTVPYVHDWNGRHAATVVWFDAQLDFALLRVSGLAGKPLLIDTGWQHKGTSVAIIGHPGGGKLTIAEATVLDTFIATGYDIYDRQPADRRVVSLAADIKPGSSGSPVINARGSVVGMIASRSAEFANVGYALAAEQFATTIETALKQNQAVSTGTCRNR